jgi:fructoselysine-6-P-deglycase FrlB-like protein
MDANLFFQDLEAKSELLEALSVQLGRINPWRGEKLTPENDFLFVGMGSSHYASSVAAARLRSQGVLAYAELASNSLLPKLTRKSVIIAVSASGKSEETNSVINSLVSSHRVIALTNDLDSPLAQMSTSAIAMHAAVEVGSVVCRTYTHTLALERSLEDAILDKDSSLIRDLSLSSRAMAHLLETRDSWLPRFRHVMTTGDGSYFVAPAERLANAQQSALMMREGPRRPAVGCETGDWSHVDVYLTKTIDYRMALFAGSPWESNLINWCTRRHSSVVAIGAEIEGATYSLRYPGDENKEVRFFTESFISELLAADCWINP